MKKRTISKMPRTFILNNNDAENSLTNRLNNVQYIIREPTLFYIK